MSVQHPDDDELLLDGLRASKVLVLATRSASGELRATPLYQVLSAALATPCLVFASKADSEHGLHLGEGPTAVAAAIHAPHDSIGTIRGVQLRGEVFPIARCTVRPRALLRDAYLMLFPMAAPLLARSLLTPPGKGERLYVLTVDWAKLTDNERLGMGVHREWVFPSGREELGLELE